MDDAKLTERVEIDARVVDWLTVHGVMCLGLRHPHYGGPSRALAIQFVQKLGQALVDVGLLTEEELKQIQLVERHAGVPI